MMPQALVLYVYIYMCILFIHIIYIYLFIYIIHTWKPCAIWCSLFVWLALVGQPGFSVFFVWYIFLMHMQWLYIYTVANSIYTYRLIPQGHVYWHPNQLGSTTNLEPKKDRSDSNGVVGWVKVITTFTKPELLLVVEMSLSVRLLSSHTVIYEWRHMVVIFERSRVNAKVVETQTC